ncbi:MAG TPA: hypothetical protein VFN39_12720 [Gemmatimonadaceae bacterium]|nr:hypothetical protein [Gemmatimonadaceae bacterium]
MSFAPPYALTPTTFRFRALAALAGRAPLGGGRETALASYVVARLAVGCLPDSSLPLEDRTNRAAAARTWLASLALPMPVRAPLVKVIESTRHDSRPAVGAALVTVADVAASYLDGPAVAELRELAAQLT